MQVEFEGSSLFQKYPTGITRYGVNLIQSIQRRAEVGIALPFSRIGKFLSDSNNELKSLVSFKSYRTQTFLNKTKLIHGLDFKVPNWKQASKVLTIHDIYLFLDNSDQISPIEYREKKLSQIKESIAFIDRFVAVSEATKNDFCEYFSISEDIVDVTHLAPEEKFFEIKKFSRDQLLPPGLPKNFLLFVGTFSERKNCKRIVEAFAKSKTSSEMPLVLAGSSLPNFSIRKLISEFKIEDKVFVLDFISDDQLIALYDRAQAFIFPTLYEGFGIPLLEAASRGCPVLAGSKGAAPEVMKNFATYADPFDIESIISGIENVVNTKADFNKVTELIEFSRGYSWDKTADRTLESYKKLLVE